MILRRVGCGVGVVLAVACASTPPPARTVDEVLAPYLPTIRLGDSLAAARTAVPALAPTGWTDGPRATWLAPSIEDGLEVETEGDRVRAVTVTFAAGRADAVERDLRARLGPAVACSALPEGISSFQPTLWRIPDGGAVSLVRKQKILNLRVERPATPAFEQAWSSCGGR